MEYLQSITGPLTSYGTEVLLEDSHEGVNLIVIPRDESEYGALIGREGAHADAMRTMMRAWSGTNTGGDMRINVLVPKPSRIHTTYI